MRRSSLIRAGVLAAAIWLLLLPSAVGAFPLTNCTVQAASTTASGAPLDTLTSGDTRASQTAPFLVDWDGQITWSGTSSIELKNNTYHVEVFGIPTPIQGGSPNQDDNRKGAGQVGVSANAPFRITGLYYVSGAITGSGGTCEGSGYFKLTGDPVGTPPFWLALLLLIVGVLLLIAGLRGNIPAGLVGGVIAGLGVAILLVISSSLVAGPSTPLVALIAGLAIGIVDALAGRMLAARSPGGPSAA